MKRISSSIISQNEITSVFIQQTTPIINNKSWNRILMSYQILSYHIILLGKPINLFFRPKFRDRDVNDLTRDPPELV